MTLIEIAVYENCQKHITPKPLYIQTSNYIIYTSDVAHRAGTAEHYFFPIIGGLASDLKWGGGGGWAKALPNPLAPLCL